MAKPVDLVQVIKWESADGGGNPADDVPFPAGINADEDAVSAAGFSPQASGVRDSSLMIWRDGNDMMFEDLTVGSGVSLQQLTTGSSGGTGITEPQHESLATLTHNIAQTHNLQYDISADGLIQSVDAEDSLTVDLRVTDQLQVTSDGLIAGMRVRQFDNSGNLQDTLTLSGIISTGIPTTAGWVRS